MNFRTNIQLQKVRNQLDYNSKLLLIGSCFSENIFNKLAYFKFQATSNPFGILFNPKAIETLITNAINNKTYTEKDIFQLNERWHCLDAHSDLSANTSTQLLHNLNNAIEQTHHFLTKASHIFLTFGTAWVYRHIESDQIVGNCHKIPQKKFLKELLTVEEIQEILDGICVLIKDINPTATIVFTVSPVRHLKDGFTENARSKAHLLTAIHSVLETQNSFSLHYFPSYEIMMDDLREYRFYNNDMLHPNDTAIQYIWEQFQQVWITEKSVPIMKEIDTIQKGLAHKPFNPNAQQYQDFLNTIQQKIVELNKLFPQLKF